MVKSEGRTHRTHSLPFTIHHLFMFVELNANTNVGRVRSGNEDNYLVLDLSTQRAWTGSDGEAPPREMQRFEVGERGVVLVVSHGMGGALAGGVARRLAVAAERAR